MYIYINVYIGRSVEPTLKTASSCLKSAVHVRSSACASINNYIWYIYIYMYISIHRHISISISIYIYTYIIYMP